VVERSERHVPQRLICIRNRLLRGTALRPRLWDTDGNGYIDMPDERSDDWQKLKLENQHEFVIGGYRPAGNAINALLVGYYDDTGFRFAGKVRAGLVPHLRREIAKALQPLHVDRCPFVDLPNSKPTDGAAV
jgi:hypothetical protein